MNRISDDIRIGSVNEISMISIRLLLETDKTLKAYVIKIAQ
jgi:hypothetical protein